jgi:hypothetical protein
MMLRDFNYWGACDDTGAEADGGSGVTIGVKHQANIKPLVFPFKINAWLNWIGSTGSNTNSLVYCRQRFE